MGVGFSKLRTVLQENVTGKGRTGRNPNFENDFICIQRLTSGFILHLFGVFLSKFSNSVITKRICKNK